MTDPLTDMLRNGAKPSINQAVEPELEELFAAHANRLAENGRTAVARNVYLPESKIQTGIGPVAVRIPQLRSKGGIPILVHSALWFHRMYARQA